MAEVVEPKAPVSGTSHEGHCLALAGARFACCRAIGRGPARDPRPLAGLPNGAQEAGANQHRASDPRPEQSAPRWATGLVAEHLSGRSRLILGSVLPQQLDDERG